MLWHKQLAKTLAPCQLLLLLLLLRRLQPVATVLCQHDPDCRGDVRARARENDKGSGVHLNPQLQDVFLRTSIRSV